MRILRIIAGGALMLVGGYLALVSLLVGCTQQTQAMGEGDPVQWFLFIQGLPPSIGTYVVGLVGMLLMGAGYAVATSGRD